MLAKRIALAERIVLASIFGLSCYGKALEGRHRRVAQIAAYKIMGEKASAVTATLLPVGEGLISASLLTGVGVRYSSVASSTLMLAFAGAAGSALSRGIVTDCGCFGRLSRQRVSGVVVARNIALAAVSLHLARTARARRRG